MTEESGAGGWWGYAKRDPRIGLAAAALVGVLAGLVVHAAGAPDTAAFMAGIAALMAFAWVSEVIPIPVTSLIPIVLLPLFGIADLKRVTASYGKPVVYLFLGGFLLALALQRSRLHRRIALTIVAAVGSDPRRLILGFMLASGALSMWISNTASVLVMMPIGLAVLEEAKDSGADPDTLAKLGTAAMLGIAYAADIGGMATPVGTPPNLVLIELHGELIEGAAPIGFAQWMTFGLPLSALFMTGGWLLLTRVLYRFGDAGVFAGSAVIREARAALGPMRRDEWVAGGVFGAAAALWMTGADLQLGSTVVPGWRGLLGVGEVGDAAVAVGAAVLLFAIPSRDHAGETMLTWKDARRVPWGLLLLFGGGFALATGFEASALSASIGGWLTGLEGLPPLLTVGVVSLVITFLTEVTSNTATTSLVLPILARAAGPIGVDPLLLMVPATLSASCAFMMPVASPTQAIVFGSGHVKIREMVRAGIGFNLLGVLLVTLVFWLIGRPALGIAG